MEIGIRGSFGAKVTRWARELFQVAQARRFFGVAKEPSLALLAGSLSGLVLVEPNLHTGMENDTVDYTLSRKYFSKKTSIEFLDNIHTHLVPVENTFKEPNI